MSEGPLAQHLAGDEHGVGGGVCLTADAVLVGKDADVGPVPLGPPGLLRKLGRVMKLRAVSDK